MLVAFVLGLMGSLGHCVGMCSGVAVLLSRQRAASGWRVLVVHAGRVITYGLLGLATGVLGQAVLLVLSYCSPAAGGNILNQTVATLLPNLGRLLQGILAVTVAGLAGYMALALLGRVPSPELYLVKLTGRWGRVMRSLTGRRAGGNFWSAFLLGLMWGLLPCGLVLTALLAAAATTSAWQGAVTMLAFGLGTWPALLGTGLVTRFNPVPATAMPWSRQMAAIVVLLFGSQMALRGLAAWGWVNHLHLGEVVIW